MFLTCSVAPTPSSTSSDLLYGMLAETKALATRRAQYTEQISNEVMARLDTLIRDTTLIARKVPAQGDFFHVCLRSVFRGVLYQACCP